MADVADGFPHHHDAHVVHRHAESLQRVILDDAVIFTVARQFQKLIGRGPVVRFSVGFLIGAVRPLVPESVDDIKLFPEGPAFRPFLQILPERGGIEAVLIKKNRILAVPFHGGKPVFLLFQIHLEFHRAEKTRLRLRRRGKKRNVSHRTGHAQQQCERTTDICHVRRDTHGYSASPPSVHSCFRLIFNVRPCKAHVSPQKEKSRGKSPRPFSLPYSGMVMLSSGSASWGVTLSMSVLMPRSGSRLPARAFMR